MTSGGDMRGGRRPSRSGARWWLVLFAGAPIIGLAVLLQPYLGEFNAKAAAGTFVVVWVIGYIISRWTGRR